VQESSSKTQSWRKLRRIKPSKLSKEAQEVCALESEKALQVCVAGGQVPWKNHFGKKLQKSSREETDGRNSLWRIREVP
jgi:hypothetical protein